MKTLVIREESINHLFEGRRGSINVGFRLLGTIERKRKLFDLFEVSKDQNNWSEKNPE